MKRVLIFSLTYYPDFVGGAEMPVKKTTDRIDPDSVAFDMITLRLRASLPKKERIGNVMVYRIGFCKSNPLSGDLIKFPLKLNKYLYPFLSWYKAARLHRAHHYDALWSVMTSYASFGALFFKMSHPAVKYLFTLNDGDPIEYLKRKARFVYPLFVRLFTKADLVHAPSTYLGNFARSMGYRGDVEFIPNALDVEDFARDYPEAEISAVRQKLGKKPGDIFLITTSRLVKKNAVDDVIRSLGLMPENVHFFILGKGPDMEMLERLVKSEGVAARVHFLGHVDLKEIPKYLKACDIFVRPSLSEGMGNSPIEAMAAGLPVVSTQVGGLADSIIDPDRNPDKRPTALAVDARSPEQIARQVKRFLNNREERERIVAYAKEFSQTNYNSTAIDKAMRERVFGKLLR